MIVDTDACVTDLAMSWPLGFDYFAVIADVIGFVFGEHLEVSLCFLGFEPARVGKVAHSIENKNNESKD